MTATERLRAMLDERGVEWMPSVWSAKDETFYKVGEVGFLATEMSNGRMKVCTAGYPTPEQAIEATLGRGECEKLPSDGTTRCFVRRYGYEREFGYWKCSACGCECFEGARYCMGCGRKVRE